MMLAYNHQVANHGNEIEKLLLEDAYTEALSACITQMTEPGRLRFPLLTKLSGVYNKMAHGERGVFEKALFQFIVSLAIEIARTHTHMTLNEIFSTWKIAYLKQYFSIPEETIIRMKDKVGLWRFQYETY